MHARPADAAAVEVGEELRLGFAGDRDERVVVLADLAQPRDEPRRRVVEVVLGREFDVRPAHVGIDVPDVDEARSGRVCLAGDGARERRVLEAGRDGEGLPWLQVDADSDDELRVGLEPAVVRRQEASNISRGSDL